MGVLFSVICITSLSFSYVVVKKMLIMLYSIFKIHKFSESNVVYIWGTLVIIIYLFYNNNISLYSPINLKSTLLLIVVIFVVNLLISRYSGYNPTGRKDIINFVIVFPIVEEILFRGLLIPIISENFNYETAFEIAGLPLTTSVILSALLFSLSHLQYYQFNKNTMKYMLFALAGGLGFGLIAYYTNSILVTILLHVEFNFLAFLSAKKSSKP
ncbi:CAAX protease self-immunity [Paenibacillus polysaccharolyticus]|uniref:CAAX protease self-immunity n=1 Tax=Paenibacillus polysaccharolyticus TaxID=582692 RepID=A0A1G5BCP2_9BACL|nr:CPBP family intramembrane glutamic endopeptidase [Paenibacillus polysaccharolyticus]SCX87903.1 CAAX protease self-immunity [Paenibacillus polysaccharolyticus]